MARQTGNPIVGTIDGMSYYHDKVHGYLLRKAGGPSKQQIRRKKSFYLVRKNISVFGESSAFNSQLRRAFNPLLMLAKDYYTSRRLQSHIYRIVRLIRLGHARPEEALEKEFNTFELLEKSCFTQLFKNTPKCLVQDNIVQVKGRLSVQPKKAGKATHIQFTTCVAIVSNSWKIERTESQQSPVLQLGKLISLDQKHDLGKGKFKGFLFYGVAAELFREEKGDIRSMGKAPSCGFLSYKGVVE